MEMVVRLVPTLRLETVEDRIRYAVKGLSPDEILDLVWYLMWVAHYRRLDLKATPYRDVIDRDAAG